MPLRTSVAPYKVHIKHIGFDSAIMCQEYAEVSNISRTLAVNKIVDHSDVVVASPVGAAPTTSSFST